MKPFEKYFEDIWKPVSGLAPLQKKMENGNSDFKGNLDKYTKWITPTNNNP